MVIEFLHRVIATFVDYFEEFTDNAVKENCVMVFEVIFFHNLFHCYNISNDLIGIDSHNFLLWFISTITF